MNLNMNTLIEKVQLKYDFKLLRVIDIKGAENNIKLNEYFLRVTESNCRSEMILLLTQIHKVDKIVYDELRLSIAEMVNESVGDLYDDIRFFSFKDEMKLFKFLECFIN
jgi:hypothetical protein